MSFKDVSRVFKVSFKHVSGVFKVSFKSVSRVLKGTFMGVSIVFVFIEVIAATRAYGGLVFYQLYRKILSAACSSKPNTM